MEKVDLKNFRSQSIKNSIQIELNIFSVEFVDEDVQDPVTSSAKTLEEEGNLLAFPLVTQ